MFKHKAASSSADFPEVLPVFPRSIEQSRHITLFALVHQRMIVKRAQITDPRGTVHAVFTQFRLPGRRVSRQRGWIGTRR